MSMEYCDECQRMIDLDFFAEHTDTHEQEFMDELVGRGKGDPDMYGYPGEPK